MGQRLTHYTTDHDTIRQWAEDRGGQPACVRGTGGRRGRSQLGMIRLDFPGYSGEGSLEPISWDEWFEAFDQNNLALAYQEQTAAGEQSNFNKLVSADSTGSRDDQGPASRPARSRSAGPQRRASARPGSGRRSSSRGGSRAGRSSGGRSRAGSGSRGGSQSSSGSRSGGSRSSNSRSGSRGSPSRSRRGSSSRNSRPSGSRSGSRSSRGARSSSGSRSRDRSGSSRGNPGR